MKKFTVVLCVMFFVVSCSKNVKVILLTNKKDIKKETLTKFDKKRIFDHNLYKNYIYDTKIYKDEKLYAIAYDFDNDKEVDLYAFYSIEKAYYNKSQMFLIFNKYAKMICVGNDSCNIIYSSLLNKKQLNCKNIIKIEKTKDTKNIKLVNLKND